MNHSYEPLYRSVAESSRQIGRSENGAELTLNGRSFLTTHSIEDRETDALPCLIP